MRRLLYYLFFILIINCYIKSITSIKKKENNSLEKNIKNICEKWKEMNRHYNACYPEIEDESLLDNEIIDVLIKYIDLSDENLHREGLPNIKKDIENGEIKYSIRSILENIPWINKIYILMPNDKVKYFKEPEFIKDKIIYLRDKDVLGFDSASSITFEFNLWRLKNFNISTNFMYFNDDCFVGKRLKKSDLFYQENGEVHPYILGKNTKLDKKYIQWDVQKSLKDISKRKSLKQDPKEFHVNRDLAILFIYKLFGNDAIIKKFNHNAFGDNLIENEEIYNVTINYYDYPDECTKAIKRELKAMNYQHMRINYMINKYNRRFKIMDARYYDITQMPNYCDLFVINKGGQAYSYLDFGKSLIKMNKMFPIPNKYEKLDVENGYYRLETLLKKNMNINIDYNNDFNETTLILKQTNQNENEIFKIEYQNDGTYGIKSLAYDSFIGISGNQIYDSEFNFTLEEYTYQLNNKIVNDKQKWFFLTNTETFFFIVSAFDSKCALDVSSKNIRNGVEIKCLVPNGGRHQLYKLIRIDTVE